MEQKIPSLLAQQFASKIIEIHKYPSSHNHGSGKMGPSNIRFLSFRVVFHFHDYGRKGIHHMFNDFFHGVLSKNTHSAHRAIKPQTAIANMESFSKGARRSSHAKPQSPLPTKSRDPWSRRPYRRSKRSRCGCEAHRTSASSASSATCCPVEFVTNVPRHIHDDILEEHLSTCHIFVQPFCTQQLTGCQLEKRRKKPHINATAYHTKTRMTHMFTTDTTGSYSRTTMDL